MNKRILVSFVALVVLSLNVACATVGGESATSEDLLAGGGPWPHGETCSSEGRTMSRSNTDRVTMDDELYVSFTCIRVGEGLKFRYLPPSPKPKKDDVVPQVPGSDDDLSPAESSDDAGDKEIDEDPGMLASKIMHRCKTQGGDCTKADFAKFYELAEKGGYTVEDLGFDPKEVEALKAKASEGFSQAVSEAVDPITLWAQSVVDTCLNDEAGCNRGDLQRVLDWRDKKVPEVLAVDIEGPALQKLRAMIVASSPTAISTPGDSP